MAIQHDSEFLEKTLLLNTGQLHPIVRETLAGPVEGHMSIDIHLNKWLPAQMPIKKTLQEKQPNRFTWCAEYYRTLACGNLISTSQIRSEMAINFEQMIVSLIEKDNIKSIDIPAAHCPPTTLATTTWGDVDA